MKEIGKTLREAAWGARHRRSPKAFKPTGFPQTLARIG
jgi:hypothetical protein